MSLPNLASVADLQAYMQAPVDEAAAVVALRLASGAIRRYTRQALTFVADDTFEMDGGERVLVLPQRPVVVDAGHPLTVVELVDMAGVEVPAVEGRDFTRHGAELRRGYPYWATSRTMGWPWNRPVGIWADRIRVTYSHGFAEIPDDLVGVCLDLAAATVANPGRLRSMSVGGISQVFTVETFGTGSLTADHRDILRGYRRTVRSVALS